MRIGIDLGGTKIEGIVLHGEAVLARRRVDTPQGDYPATLQGIADLVAALEQDVEMGPLPVGLGHPGSLSPSTGRLRNANSTCLNGQAFAEDIEAQLQRPVALANDANCLALSELHNGAARNCDSAFLVILGTGVGGAVVQNGQLQIGANALAGEWGHNPLSWPRPEEVDGPVCWCGRRGCNETWLSGPALSRWHAAQGHGEMTARQIAAAAASGDPGARASLSAYVDRLARSLATVINLLDPERIVLAGGLSQLDCLYDDVPSRWGEWVFAEAVVTRLVPARHGAASGVLGAARLA